MKSPRGAAPAAGATPPDAPALVLVVDDDPDVLAYLRRILAHRFPRFTIETAPDAPTALGLLDWIEPDVILSDHVMPGMDGVTFLAAAREEHPDAFRILLTGFADTPLALRAINQGHVHAFLEKPVHESRLFLTMEKALERRAERVADAAPPGHAEARAPRAVPVEEPRSIQEGERASDEELHDAAPPHGDVLVVDDDAEVRRVVTAYFGLRLPSVQVHTASTAHAGLDILAHHHVDVILADYRLPDMSGTDFLAETRHDHPGARRVLITGAPEVGLARDAWEDKGIDRFFIKPVDMAAFARVVAHLLPRD